MTVSLDWLTEQLYYELVRDVTWDTPPDFDTLPDSGFYFDRAQRARALAERLWAELSPTVTST
jgi:hypothetical protein